jgi:DNA-directed RNA polymerase subunit RPC12/RpoP
MPRRFPCPACTKEMFLEKVHEGFEVPCPACGHRFLVPPGSTDEPPGAPPPAASRYPAQGSPPLRDQYGGAIPPPRRPGGDSGTLVLVLGILAITVCGLLGPFAWYMGQKARREAREAGEEPSSQVTVGWALGIASSVLLIAAAVLAIGFTMIAVVGSTR